MSKGFYINVGVHPDIFFHHLAVEATKKCKKGDPHKVLYADNIVITEEDVAEIKKKKNKTNENEY